MAISFAGHPAAESIVSASGKDIGTWMAPWGVSLAMLSADAEKAQANGALASATSALSAAAAGGPWPPAQAAVEGLVASIHALAAAAQAQGRVTLVPAVKNIATMLSNDLGALSMMAAPPAPPPPPPTYVQQPYMSEAPHDPAAEQAGYEWSPPGEAPAAAAAPAADPAYQQEQPAQGPPVAPQYVAPGAPPSAPQYAPPAAPQYAPQAAPQAPAQPARQYGSVYGGAADPMGMRSGVTGRGLNQAYQMHHIHHPSMQGIARAYGQSVTEWLNSLGIGGLSILGADREMETANRAFQTASQLCSQIPMTGRAPQGTKEALNELIAEVRSLAYIAAMQQQIRFSGPLESLADSINHEVNGRGHFRF